MRYFLKAADIFDFTTPKSEEFLIESSLTRILCIQEHFGEVVNHAKKALEAAKSIQVPEKELGRFNRQGDCASYSSFYSLICLFYAQLTCICDYAKGF